MNVMNKLVAAPLLVLVVMGLFSSPLRGQSPATPQQVTLFFPDLFYKTTTPLGDTTFSYEYLDRHEKTISIYDVTDADQVRYVKYYKVFHAQIPSANNIVSAPTQYMMLYEYAHPTKEVWVRFDRKMGETIRYKSYKDKIIGADTITINDPKTKGQIRFIYKYYKTEITEQSTATGEHEHDHEH